MNPMRIYVFPEYGKRLKIKAAKAGMSLIRFTKENVESIDTLHLLAKERSKNEKKFFDFP